MPADKTVSALEVHNISKTFGGVKALTDVAFKVLPGEIHGLLGQNGSGKSTLIKVLSGYHTPDEGGTMSIGATGIDLPVRAGRARALGLSFVHQDLGIVDQLTVLENMLVGRYRVKGCGPIRWRWERRRAQEAVDRFGLRIRVDDLARRLTDTDRALIAIVRAVEDVREAPGGGILLLDEPTVYLPKDSLDRLFMTMRGVAQQGTAIIFVTHQLGEVKQVTDRVTVLRDGRVVDTLATPSVTETELIEVILGRPLGDLYPTGESSETTTEVLTLSDVCGATVTGVNLTIHAGETVGVTGLVGAGYEEIPYLIFGARAGDGRISLGGNTYEVGRRTPRASIAAGLALVPANRLRDAVAVKLSVQENVGLPLLGRFFRRGLLRTRELRQALRKVLKTFGVRPPDPERRLGTLSGGNQQKAVLAKWLQNEPRVLLLHEPTQGVDVGARSQIFSLLSAAAEKGTGVIIASSEHEDLAHLCDRVIVFRDGSQVSELRGDAVQAERILEESYRSKRVEASIERPF